MQSIISEILNYGATRILNQGRMEKSLESSESYQGLSLISGIGAQVKKTVTKRKDRLPHTSDSAPIRGADINDRRP